MYEFFLGAKKSVDCETSRVVVKWRYFHSSVYTQCVCVIQSVSDWLADWLTE